MLRTGKVAKTAVAVVAATMLVAAVFVSTPVTEHYDGFGSDGRRYGAMAGEPSLDPALAEQAPWRYRVLTPYLASRLPFDALSNFQVLAVLANIGSLLLLGLILARLEFSPRLSLIGVLLYAGSFWTLKFSFYSPAYVDSQTQLFLLLAIYLTLSRAYLALPLVFAAGVLQKESLAVFAVFSIVHLWRYDDTRRPWLRAGLTLTMLGFPLAAGLAVRSGVSAGEPSVVAVLLRELATVGDPAFWPVLLQATFSGLGLLPVILLLPSRAWTRFLARRWEWIVYAVISIALLLGGHDKSRLLLYALPLVVILSLHTLDDLEPALSRRTAAPLILAVLALHWYVGSYLTPIGPFMAYLERMVPEYSEGAYTPHLLRNLTLAAAVYVTTMACLIWRRRSESARVHA